MTLFPITLSMVPNVTSSLLRNFLWVSLYIALLIGLFLPLLALAHSEAGTAGSTGFMTGMLHPVTGVDHVIAMVAVGLWGAQLGKPALWMLPVAFPMIMAFGGAAGAMGVGLPGVEVGIALSGLFLGTIPLLDT